MYIDIGPIKLNNKDEYALSTNNIEALNCPPIIVKAFLGHKTIGL